MGVPLKGRSEALEITTAIGQLAEQLEALEAGRPIPGAQPVSRRSWRIL